MEGAVAVIRPAQHALIHRAAAELDRLIGAAFICEQSSPWSLVLTGFTHTFLPPHSVSSGCLPKSWEVNWLVKSSEYPRRLFAVAGNVAVEGDEFLGAVLAKLAPLLAPRQTTAIDGSIRQYKETRIRTGVVMLGSDPLCLLLHVTSPDHSLPKTIIAHLQQSMPQALFLQLDNPIDLHIRRHLDPHAYTPLHSALDILEAVRLHA